MTTLTDERDDTLFILHCPVVTDDNDVPVFGCGRRWMSTSRTEPCPICGLLGKVERVLDDRPDS